MAPTYHRAEESNTTQTYIDNLSNDLHNKFVETQRGTPTFAGVGGV